MLTKKADQHKVVINEASLWSMSKWGTGGSCMIIKLCRTDLMYLKRNVIIPGIYFPLLPSEGVFDILLLLCLQQMDTHPIGKQPANSHHKKCTTLLLRIKGKEVSTIYEWQSTRGLNLTAKQQLISQTHS